MEEALRDTIFSKSFDSFRLSDNNSARNTEENSQEDCLPFFLDDDSSGPEGSPSFSNRRSRMKSTYGFSLDTQVDGKEAKSNVLNNIDFSPGYSSSRHNLENTNFKPNINKFPDDNLNEGRKPLSQRSMPVRSRVVDSLELIDQDYVIVSGPPLEVSSSLSSKPSHILSSPPRASVNVNTAPVRITSNTNPNICNIGSLESRSSAPGTSQESMDAGYVLENPSTHCVLTRIKSLQRCASAISELVREKVEAGRQLEAFSIELVILAIWKQALHICHTQAASAIEGSPSKENSRLKRSNSKNHGTSDTEDSTNDVPADISTQIEREFLREVEHAEELAKAVDPGNVEMPDAMETIFQSALAFGRHGGVEELMGETESASFLYSKAVQLLVFLLAEASSLILNPPFSLTNSDRYRLRSYIDILSNRQASSRSQRMGLLKSEELQCPP